MADTKISALTGATTPVAGTEVLPIVQSSTTVNVSIANLTAGRNISFNNTLPGFTTTATAAGTTTLTASSTYYQRFSGSTTQTVVLPSATTMATGQGFVIDNDSSGNLTLQDGSAGALGIVVPGMAAYAFCENNSTTAGSWSGYMFVPGSGPSGQVTWGTAGLAMGGQTISSSVLSNPTITAYLETAPTLTNSSTAVTLSLSSGTVLSYTLTGNCTFTMPTATSGTSFIVKLIQDGTGSRTATFTGVKWPGGTAPTITTTATTGLDILSFVCINSVWYGTYAQAFA